MDIGDSSSISQHLTVCPSCGKPAAAHVALEQGEPLLVRLICADGCADNDRARVAVIDALYGSAIADGACA